MTNPGLTFEPGVKDPARATGDGGGGGGGDALFSYDASGLEDANPWVLPDSMETDRLLGSGNAIEVVSGRLWIDDNNVTQSAHAVHIKQAALDLNGKASGTVTLTRVQWGSASGSGRAAVALIADLAPGEWEPLGNQLANGYRLTFRWDTGGTLRVFLIRDVEGSETFVDAGTLAINPTEEFDIEFAWEIGESSVSVVVTAGEEADTLQDSNAARHENFRLVGFGMESSGGSVAFEKIEVN